MKKLVLIRHAKAEKESVVNDIDRPLKYTGIQDARFMAEKVKEKSLVPQVFFASPALRTITTAEIFADYLLLPEPEIVNDIYLASLQTLVKTINKFPAKYDFIGLVGHNPGMGEILAYLTGTLREVHTCAVAVIDFETDNWAEITKGSGNLSYYGSPKE